MVLPPPPVRQLDRHAGRLVNDEDLAGRVLIDASAFLAGRGVLSADGGPDFDLVPLAKCFLSTQDAVRLSSFLLALVDCTALHGLQYPRQALSHTHWG